MNFCAATKPRNQFNATISRRHRWRCFAQPRCKSRSATVEQLFSNGSTSCLDAQVILMIPLFLLEHQTGGHLTDFASLLERRKVVGSA